MGEDKIHTCKNFITTLQDGNQLFFSDVRGQGALRHLNQAFPHGWVYVAELLQNAIDEKAQHVRFAVEGDRLVVEHDGLPFAEENVRGLCSAGLSTKGAGTVGFMGVGFKSVFHAFERVDVSSADWRFSLEVGWATGSVEYGERIRHWLGAVLPNWSDDAVAPSSGMFCRFVFSARNAGLPPIAEDLDRVLQKDLSLLPLLARRGIRRLDWNGASWELTCEEHPTPKDGVRLFIIEARQLDGSEQRSWRLLVSDYEPTPAGIQQFLEHRQLTPPDAGEKRAQFYAEAARHRTVEAFFEVGRDGVPHLPETGRAFAVLPMEMTLPVRFHIQADWLLVVTRADPKNLDDETPWHTQIREQIPGLLAAYVAWLVSESRGTGWEAGYDVLPDFTRTDTAGGQWLLHDSFRQQLGAQLDGLPFLPTFAPDEFIAPKDGLFAPPAFQQLFNEQWKPLILLGERAVAWNELSARVAIALKELGLWRPLLPSHLMDRDLVSWVGLFERQNATLIWLLEALSEAEARDGGEWATAPLVCLPTQAGGWRSRSDARRLPPDWNLLGSAPELAERLRQFAGRPDELLKWDLWQEVATPSRDSAEGSRRVRARRYLEKVPARGLDELVNQWWSQFPDRPDAMQAKDVLRLTWWVRQAQPTRKAYIQRLLCHDAGGLCLMPPKRALLADPYGPAYRRQFFPNLPVVIGEYLEDDPGLESTAGDWISFFSGLPDSPSGAFIFNHVVEPYSYSRLKETLGLSSIPSSRASWCQVAHPIAGRVSNGEYKVVNSELPSGWPAGAKLPPTVARDAVLWLESGVEQLQRFSHLRLVYIPERSNQCDDGKITSIARRADWVEQLRSQAWVPVKGGIEACKPADVLPAYDPSRPEAPAAALSPELVEVLTAAGVSFGDNIAQAPSVVRLEVEGPRAALSHLVELIQEAITETNGEEVARYRLLQVLLTTPLLPAAPARPDERRAHERFVSAAGRGSQRSDFGGWLTSVSAFEADTPARAVLDAVHALVPFPETTTGEQALAFLRYAWEAEFDAETVRRLLPMAYQYVLDELPDRPSLTAEWEAALPGAKAFVRQRGWLLARELYLNDLQGADLPPDLLSGYPCASPAHLGETQEQRHKVAHALGISLLSNHFDAKHVIENARPASRRIQEALEAVREVVVAIRQTAIQREERADEEPTPSATDVSPVPAVWEADRLELTITSGGEERLRRLLAAVNHGGRLYVTGPSHRYAGDLTVALVQLWRLSQRGDLVARIGPLLSLIDQEQVFQDALNDLLISLGLIFPTQAAEAAVSKEPSPTAPESGAAEAGAEPAVEPFIPDERTGARDNEAIWRRALRDQSAGDSSGGTSGGSSMGSSGGGNASPERQSGSGSYTPESIDNHRQSLLSKLRSIQGMDVIPAEFLDNDDETDAPVDHEYRQAVIDYERRQNRYAVALDDNQPGFDIESFDLPAEDPARKLVRRIEVKGRGLAWAGVEVVTLSRRQFTEALGHKPTELGWDYWLYVVQKNLGGGYTVRPIRNPAHATTRYELRAGAWSWLAQEER